MGRGREGRKRGGGVEMEKNRGSCETLETEHTHSNYTSHQGSDQYTSHARGGGEQGSATASHNINEYAHSIQV